MPHKKKEMTHVLVLGTWAVEERNEKYKVHLLVTMQGFTLQQQCQTKWKVLGTSSTGLSPMQVRRTFAAANLEEALDQGGRLDLEPFDQLVKRFKFSEKSLERYLNFGALLCRSVENLHDSGVP